MALIEFAEIPVLRFVDEEAAVGLKAIFNLVEKNHGDVLVAFGHEVPGLFLIVDGAVDVYTEDFKTHLATLKRGASFGEMSMIDEKNEWASAQVVVSSKKIRLLFCERGAFRKHLVDHPQFANTFHRGAAVMLSERLRETNQKAFAEIKRGSDFVVKMIRESELVGNLGRTQKDINDTSYKLIQDLFAVVPQLERISTAHPNCAADINVVKKKLESILLGDFQNFDRISQQLDLILQYFGNIKRALAGDSLLPFTGDRSLFDVAPVGG